MAATTLGPAVGLVEMRHTGAIPRSTDRRRSSPQNSREVSRWMIAGDDYALDSPDPFPNPRSIHLGLEFMRWQ